MTTSPVRNIVPNLVYAATGWEVADSMVAGEWLMRNHDLLKLSLEDIRAAAQFKADQLSKQLTADPSHRELALVQQMNEDKL